MGFHEMDGDQACKLLTIEPVQAGDALPGSGEAAVLNHGRHGTHGGVQFAFGPPGGFRVFRVFRGSPERWQPLNGVHPGRQEGLEQQTTDPLWQDRNIKVDEET